VLAPLEPWEKVLISKAYFNTDHADIECVGCHGGDREASERTTAHKGLVKDPTATSADKVCGDCHEEIMNTASKSLHASPIMGKILKQRTSTELWSSKVDLAYSNHCAQCHSSCGECHVSRPETAGSGFVKGHIFQAKSDTVNQCTACHGSRIGMEYFGERGIGDVHLIKEKMDCVDCHDAREMHAKPPEDVKGRFGLPEMPACTDCHEEVTQDSPVKEHKTHAGKVQCQICHAQPYVNCSGCHVGKDVNGLAYYKTEKEIETFKIGLNPEKTKSFPYDFMLIRQTPVNPHIFDYYGKGLLPHFDKAPTWKRAAPHNIQRKTWIAASCNHCHGNRDVFLTKKDIPDDSLLKANRPVLVTDSLIPKRQDSAGAAPKPLAGIRKDRVVEAHWLHENLAKGSFVVADTRSEYAYKKGHIPNAIHINVFGFLQRSRGKGAYCLKSPKELALGLGLHGIDRDTPVIVYDDGSMKAGVLILTLNYLGNHKVAYLNGGVEAWQEAGYDLACDNPSKPVPKAFRPEIDAQILSDHEFVKQNLDNPLVRIVDVRSVAQYFDLQGKRHQKLEKGGHLQGMVSFPVSGFYKDGGFLRRPQELMFLLREKGITPDKTIVLTCNTGQHAAAGYAALKYLGFKDIRLHNGAMAGFERRNIPDDPLCARMVLLGRQAYLAGNYLDAKEFFRRAVQADPGSDLAWRYYDLATPFAIGEKLEKNANHSVPGAPGRGTEEKEKP
jgi:3-mercaptopyruvate sulfurtransferase SseA